MRLIDAEGLRREIDYCAFDSQTDKLTICQQIKEAPTVDAVPVVRCRECEYWDDDPDTYGRSDGPLGGCGRMDCTTAHDDFCSFGERRDEGDAEMHSANG